MPIPYRIPLIYQRMVSFLGQQRSVSIPARANGIVKSMVCHGLLEYTALMMRISTITLVLRVSSYFSEFFTGQAAARAPAS